MPVTDLHELKFFEPSYICVDGDGTVPAESSKADRLKAEARVGVPAEHRGILSDRHVFRILKHWLKVGDPDPYYNPLNDYVILPTSFEVETHKEKGLQFSSLKEEWEIISEDQTESVDSLDGKPQVSSITISRPCDDHTCCAEACAKVVVYSQFEGKQHVELNASSVSVDA